MSPVLEDPKTYLNLKPVLVYDVDCKIKARSFQHFSSALPNRENIFKQNYDRRFKQFTTRGFRSLPWQPYEVLGQPLKLDVKKLVLTTLGQDTRGSESDDVITASKTSSKYQNGASLEDQKSLDIDVDIKRDLSPAAFIMKHKQHDKLRNFDNDLKELRNTQTSVKVGKALFPLLRHQNEKEKTKILSTSGENLNKFEMINPSDDVSDDDEVKEVKPFQPIYANISEVIKYDERIVESTRRQLCVLHWLMFTCDLASNPEIFFQQKNIIPLGSCWDEIDPGGRMRDSRQMHLDSRSNVKWNRFAKNSSNQKSRSRKKLSMISNNFNRRFTDSSRISSQKSSNQTTDDVTPEVSSRTVMTSSRGRVSSISGQSSADTQVAASETGQVTSSTRDVTDDDVTIETKRVEDSGPDHDNLKKLLSTIEFSVHKELTRRQQTAELVANRNKKLPSSVYDWSRNDYFRLDGQMINISKIILPSDDVTDMMMTSPIKQDQRPHTMACATRQSMVVKGRAAAQGKPLKTRPASSPAKLVDSGSEFRAFERRKQRLEQLSAKFREVNESNSLQLHNHLSDLARKRKDRMQTKLRVFSASTSQHRDLQEMRRMTSSEQTVKIEKSEDEQEIKSLWFDKLITNLGSEMKNDQKCQIILHRLQLLDARMSRDERVVTSDAFLGVLRALHNWELCLPDVIAAVEFVRDVVVGMSRDQFEAWFEMKLLAKICGPVGHESRILAKIS